MPGWHRIALHTADQTAISWGLYHWLLCKLDASRQRGCTVTPCQDGIALPCTWLIKVPSPGGCITGDTHSRTPSGAGCCAWRLQHCLLQLLLPPRKYDPGKQNYSKTQQPTPCSHCSDVSIPHTRRTLGTICPSQLLHFPVSHPVLISAKARKPSVVELCELPEGQHSQV